MGALETSDLTAGTRPLHRTHAPVSHLQVLGRFGIRDQQGPCPAINGIPGQVLKILAVFGSLHVEHLIDLVWPECPVDTGRTRLRNVVARIRRSYHPDLVVRAEESLALGIGVVVDRASFESAANLALAIAPDDPQRASVARRALRHYAGDLLPMDRYREWTSEPRRRLQRQMVALSEILARDALDRGEPTEAVMWLERAIAAEPQVDDRYLFAAEILLGHGLRGRAELMLRRAREVLAELDLSPPPTYHELHRRLHAG